MFELIHEGAVLGTTLFMMALSSLWYSEAAFGKAWRAATKQNHADLSVSELVPKLFATFVCYAVAVFLLALGSVFGSMLSLTTIEVSAILWGSYTALLGSLVIWEGRPRSYFLITSGFAAVLFFGGGQMLAFWPW